MMRKIMEPREVEVRMESRKDILRAIYSFASSLVETRGELETTQRLKDFGVPKEDRDSCMEIEPKVILIRLLQSSDRIGREYYVKETPLVDETILESVGQPQTLESLFEVIEKELHYLKGLKKSLADKASDYEFKDEKRVDL